MWTMQHVIYYRVTYQSSDKPTDLPNSRRRSNNSALSNLFNLSSSPNQTNQSLSKSVHDPNQMFQFPNSVNLSAAITCLKRRRPDEVGANTGFSQTSLADDYLLKKESTNSELVRSRSKDLISPNSHANTNGSYNLTQYSLYQYLHRELPIGFLFDQRSDSDVLSTTNSDKCFNPIILDEHVNRMSSTLALLRNLNSLSRLWYTVHNALDPFPIFPQVSYFV